MAIFLKVKEKVVGVVDKKNRNSKGRGRVRKEILDRVW